MKAIMSYHHTRIPKLLHKSLREPNQRSINLVGETDHREDHLTLQPWLLLPMRQSFLKKLP